MRKNYTYYAYTERTDQFDEILQFVRIKIVINCIIDVFFGNYGLKTKTKNQTSSVLIAFI